MTRMIALLSIVIFLFALAAGASWYLQTQQGKEGETPHAADEKSGKAGSPAHNAKSTGDAASSRPLIRPASASETDRLTQMAESLQRQQEAIKNREQQIGTREKQMDILHDDIKREQKKLDAVRKEIQVELQLVLEKLELLEKLKTEADRVGKSASAQMQALDRSKVEVDDREWNNLKQQIKTFEKIDPEAASQVMVQMVEDGKMETVVKIMSQMRDRQAAAIFAEIAKQDAKLPGQLFERMLAVKTPTVAAPK
jgi:hypothetical protein